jgi:hypothetical protein
VYQQQPETAREDQMSQTHASTPTARALWVNHLLAHAGEYGVVSQLSREIGVSRQTLYTWSERGFAALAAAFTPAPAESAVAPALERAILTCLVDGWGEGLLRRVAKGVRT